MTIITNSDPGDEQNKPKDQFDRVDTGGNPYRDLKQPMKRVNPEDDE